ncbi:MAG: hypothetical protein GXZ11_01325 [Tissierellia bacterium]|nr:hypothetical protein [Tissierellia bacterium]
MNGNSTGNGPLKRMELEFKGISYLFTINPEMYDISIPNRQNVIYTKAGAFIDLFGEGINEITITGTTGWKAQTGNRDHGHEQFLKLKSLFQANMNNIQDGKPVKLSDLLKFYNHTDGEAYYTVPVRLRIYRNVNQPLLYKYDIALTVIKAINAGQNGDEPQTLGVDFIPNTCGKTIRDRDSIEKRGKSCFSNNHYRSAKTKGVEYR